MSGTEKTVGCSTLTDVRTPLTAAQDTVGETSTPKTWPGSCATQSPARRVTVLASPLDCGGNHGACSGPPSSAECHRHVLDMSPSAVAESRSKKPDCSYAVLIGIAIRAAQAANYGHHLPVIEIYRFIEKEFPYFKKCKTTGWKNCVRHCLSLGQFFRKVERCTTEGVAIKGNYWEVIPDKRPLLNRDIQNFVLEEYKSYIQKHTNEGNSPSAALVPTKQSTISTKDNDRCRKVIATHTPMSYVVAQLHCTTDHITAAPSTDHDRQSLTGEGRSENTHPSCVLLDEPPNRKTITCQQDSAADVTSGPYFLSTTPCTRNMALHNSRDVSAVAYYDDENPLPSSGTSTMKLTTAIECESQIHGIVEQPREHRQSSPNSPLPSFTFTPTAHPLPSLPLRQTKESHTHIPTSEDHSIPTTHNGGNITTRSVRNNPCVFPDKTRLPNAKNSHHIMKCSETMFSFVDDSEAGPLINPEHPFVNICTLASFNGGAATSERAYISTPNVVTYATAPTNHIPQLCCKSTYSNQSTARMSQRIYYPLHMTNKNMSSMLSFNNNYFNHIQTSVVKQRRREEFIHPAIQPVVKHMNDPSLFLPSSQFYNPPPHPNPRQDCRQSGDNSNEMCALDCEGDLVREEMKTQNRATDYKLYLRSSGGPWMLRTDQRNLEVVQSQDSANLNTPSNGRFSRETNGTNSHSQVPSTTSNTTVQSSADHTPSVTEEHEDIFFEVSSDWLPLTIAREEEVTSSLLDEICFDIY